MDVRNEVGKRNAIIRHFTPSAVDKYIICNVGMWEIVRIGGISGTVETEWGE